MTTIVTGLRWNAVQDLWCFGATSATSSSDNAKSLARSWQRDWRPVSSRSRIDASKMQPLIEDDERRQERGPTLVLGGVSATFPWSFTRPCRCNRGSGQRRHRQSAFFPDASRSISTSARTGRSGIAARAPRLLRRQFSRPAARARRRLPEHRRGGAGEHLRAPHADARSTAITIAACRRTSPRAPA